MLYQVLIGAGSLATDRPVRVYQKPTYTALSISMSSTNTQDSVLTSTVTPTTDKELFGFTVLEYINSFNKISNHVNVICTYLHSTSAKEHEYKLYKKAKSNEVFGVVYVDGSMVSPATIPLAWQPYIKDKYLVDRIYINIGDLRFNQPDFTNNAVIAEFNPAGGSQTFTLRVGYKHENQITSGTYLIDTFVGTDVEGTDCGFHNAVVYENDVGAANLFCYQMPTKIPETYREISDGSTMDDIDDIYRELGPIKVKVNEARDLFVSR